MAFPNVSDIIATTIENRSGEIADNVLKNNALYQKLKQKGRIKTFSGGSQIFEELSFAENGNFAFYSGYDLLNVQTQDVISSASYPIKQAACPVVISGLELLQNAGKEARINLIDARMEVAESTMINNVTAACYSDGSGYGGKQITGLAAAVPTTPTIGTYGGINAATFPFWQPQIVQAAGYNQASINTYFNNLWFQLIRGVDRPDLIVADNNVYGTYLGFLQSLQRFTQAEDGDLGFPTLKFMTCDVVLDGGIGGFVPQNTAWFLNTKYLKYRPHAERNMVPLSPSRRVSVNQDAEVEIIALAANITVSNRFLQGQFKGY